MKILHVASFVGNIGDNASHKGFYSILNQHLDAYSITELEMRKFYKNYNKADRQRFDEHFIEYANSFDMLVIGGGGFLDYWVPDSASGTTIDMPPLLVEKIKVKTLITSIGCMPHKPIPEGNIDKFRLFLDAILSNHNISIAVRNDGSKQTLKHEIGEQYYQAIPEILDSGFFYTNNGALSIPIEQPYVTINITDDQIHMLSKHRGILDIGLYYKEMGKVVDFITNVLNLRVVLVPHIHADLKAINDLLQSLNDFDTREKISVAPCLQGVAGADYLFSIYKHSKFVIASRLHANICSIAMNVPVIGIAALDRVQHIYNSLGNGHYVIPDETFSTDLIRNIHQISSELSHESRVNLTEFTRSNLYKTTKYFYAKTIN